MIALIIYSVLATIAIIVLAVYFSRCLDDLGRSYIKSSEVERELQKAKVDYHCLKERHDCVNVSYKRMKSELEDAQIKYNELASTHAKTLNAVRVLENDNKDLLKELNKFPNRDEKGRYCKRTSK